MNSNSSKRLVGTQRWIQKGTDTTNSETGVGKQERKTSVFQWMGALRSQELLVKPWTSAGGGGCILKIVHSPHHSGQRSASRKVLWRTFTS